MVFLAGEGSTKAGKSMTEYNKSKRVDRKLQPHQSGNDPLDGGCDTLWCWPS